jgi:hypothetical protein
MHERYFSNHSLVRGRDPQNSPRSSVLPAHSACQSPVACVFAFCVAPRQNATLCMCVNHIPARSQPTIVCCYLNSDGCISRIFFSPGRRTKESTATGEEEKKMKIAAGGCLIFG